ncbi:LCP family protein [Streptomyces yunnanensis]|uniref:Transcriptional attenuator, LytR family n=1 Tax=Streptomyces yunnanensis TaxID=156453 RepID=A0A9X8N7T8_9ACTN|nr:LCP family protein [Streptomyces yunnanensis]SHN24198.1 transcriptional attenuator, LytR family [Streptomyces yunnanensis]
MRIVRNAIIGAVAVALAAPVVTYAYVDQHMNRSVDLAGITAKRPEPGKGTNTLLVGSDSRQGLSEEDRNRLRVGHEPTKRTDTMMIVHQGEHGTTLVSLPRDSWVEIPDFVGKDSGKKYPATKNKLNAAYAWGGAELLTRTVEHNTGIRVDHYVEIGFKGFADIVNAVGGVEIDIKRRIKDKNSGADFQPGKQTLTGEQALAFVRQRYQEAQGDLGRTTNQQEFMKALSKKVGASNALGVAASALGSLEFDKGMGVLDLSDFALKFGEPESLNVPVSNLGYQTSKGSAVLWDDSKARNLFQAIVNDRKVTK